jgi:hypothetical protein
MRSSWLAILCACLAAAGELPIHREGAYWVQTETLTLPLGSQARLRVRTRGPIELRGGVAGPTKNHPETEGSRA